MGRQSTRHRYRSRGEKNREVARTTRLLLIGAALFVLFLLVRNWKKWWAYYGSYLEG